MGHRDWLMKHMSDAIVKWKTKQPFITSTVHESNVLSSLPNMQDSVGKAETESKAFPGSLNQQT